MLLPDFVCCAICSCAALGRGRVAGGSRCLACICRCLAMAGLPCFLQCCATASPFCRLPARPVGGGLLLFCLCRMPCCDRVYAALPVVAGGLASKMQGGCLGAVRSHFICRGHAAGPVCRHVWLRSCVSPANRGTFDGGLRLVGLFLSRRLPDMLIGVGVWPQPGPWLLPVAIVAVVVQPCPRAGVIGPARCPVPVASRRRLPHSSCLWSGT